MSRNYNKNDIDILQHTLSGNCMPLYYHRGAFSAGGDFVFYENAEENISLKNRVLKRLQKNGSVADIFNRGQSVGEEIRNGICYGYLTDGGELNGEVFLYRLDLTARTPELLHKIETPGATPAGCISVNSTHKHIVYQAVKKDGSVQVWLYSRDENASRLIYDGERQIQHTVFSPVNSDIFVYANQTADCNQARFGFYSIKSDKWTPFDFSDPYLREDGINIAHPVFCPDGGLMLDVLWNKKDVPGEFGYILVSPEDGTVKARYRAPVRNFNIHYNPLGPSGCFAGGGHDDQGYYFSFNTVNVFKCFPGGGIQYYHLAEKQGANPGHPGVNVHVDPEIRRVYFSMLYDIEKGKPADGRRIYSVGLPLTLRSELLGESNIRLVDVDVNTKGNYSGKYGSRAVYHPEEEKRKVFNPANPSVPNRKNDGIDGGIVCLNRFNAKLWTSACADGRAPGGKGQPLISDVHFAGQELAYAVSAKGGALLAVYFTNWEHNGRRQELWLEDKDGNTVLYPCEITDYPEGVYYVIRIKGDVILKVRCEKTSAVLTGIYLD